MDGPLLRRREGAVGGRPTEKGKEVATVGVDDETWVLDYVYTGIKSGGTWPAACAAPMASRPTTGGSGYHWR